MHQDHSLLLKRNYIVKPLKGIISYAETLFHLEQTLKTKKNEKLHIKFSKYILGVNKQATNFATLSELGNRPNSESVAKFHFDIIKSMIRYWNRLENLDSNFTLLKDTYEESKKLFEIKIPSWYGSITLLI